MKSPHLRILTAGLVSLTLLAKASLQLAPLEKTSGVFGGETNKLNVAFLNPDGEKFTGEIRAQIFQTSSATAVPVCEVTRGKIQVLPQQTVLETAQLDFPAVKTETKFLVQWVENTNRVIGTTAVWVYPTNLLAELKSLMSGETLGALDPQNQLKPVFKQNGIEFLDLGETTLEDFSGRLAIVGPFSSRTQMRDGLEQTIRQIARKGVAVVWIQPPPETKDEVKPSFYIVPEGKGAVVVVQPELVANFSKNPQSQLNLIYFCKLALHPVPPTLPNLSAQP